MAQRAVTGCAETGRCRSRYDLLYGVSLAWNVPETEAVPLPAHQVRQLVLNLLLNAVKAADDGGAISLQAANLVDALTIEVSNTGPGVPADIRDRMFEPFVASPDEHGRRSHGLGLWVCYQIVRQLRGTIEFRSEAPWTRFVVHLPFADGVGPTDKPLR